MPPRHVVGAERVLVFDSCERCPFAYEAIYCDIEARPLFRSTQGDPPAWCPLRCGAVTVRLAEEMTTK